MKTLLKFGLPITWILILATPPVVFIRNNGWSVFEQPLTLFPLFGLLAFTLVWSQIMLGSFMRPLEKLYPKIFVFHVAQGLLTLGFAATHWVLLSSSFLPDRLADYLGYAFVAPELKVYAIFGQSALLLLILGVTAGLLRNYPPIKRYWHWLHLVHYAVFFLVFFHSMRLGSDVQTTPILTNLWYFFFASVIAGIIYRRLYLPAKEGLINTTN